MLKLAHDPQFKALVGISVPGKKEPVEVEFTFKYLTRSGWEEFLKSNEETPLLETLPQIVEGWNEKHIEGKFSKDNLAKLLDVYPAAAMDIYKAFIEELHKSRVKN